jgi:hypothetical protein
MWFLTLCGVNWAKKPYYLPIIWSVVVLLSASIFYVLFGPFYPISFLIQKRRWTVLQLGEVGITFQGISAVFIIVHTRERMHQIVNKIDLSLFPASRRIALICLLLFYATYIPYLIYNNLQSSVDVLGNIVLPFSLLASSALLSVNLLFLIVDAKVSMSLLTSLTEQDAITAEEYKRVKAEIDNRVSKNRTNNNIVMGVALTNVIIIFFIFMISDHIASSLQKLLALLAGMSREILFAVIGFWFVALVNEKSNELTKKLSTRVLTSDIDSSVGQLKVYVTANADPISFRLAGMKLTRRDITFRFLIWLTGLFIGIARQKI